MPNKYKRKPGARRYKDYDNETLQKCLDQIRAMQITHRQAEKMYKIPRRTLLNKLKGRFRKNVGGQTVFTLEEEHTFSSCCMSLCDSGFPITREDLVHVIGSYLQKMGRKVSKFREGVYPGGHWVDGFLARNTELSLRFAANIKRKRNELTREGVQDYFHHLRQELEGIPPSNVYNYDETNLTDDPGQKKVIAKRGTKYPQKICNSSKSAVSIMFCGNAEGVLLPPYVVYKSTQMWTTWCQGGPDKTKYNHSSSGWFDGNTFTAWVRDLLIPHLKNQPGQKVLIGDNLSSHFTIAALELLKESNITLICLPPNSTHLTQPLDKAVFRSIKSKWRELLGRWKETNTGGRSTCIEKQYFPYLLSKLWDEIMPQVGKNLKSGFESCGIVPCSEEKILLFIDQPQYDHKSIHNSFIEIIERKKEEWKGVPKQRKRRRINVIPGQSVDGDTLFPTDDGPSTSNQPMQRRQKKTVWADTEEELDEDRLCEEKSDEETIEQMVARHEQEEQEDDEFENFLLKAGEKLEGDQLKPIKKYLGEYVIVNYEGSLYPGRVEAICESKVKISTMIKSLKAWKWPSPPDCIEYTWKEVVGSIQPPKPINKRGVYSVKELENEYGA